MDEGWLKIFRKLTEWEWYNHSEMVHLFIHLLLKASPTDKVWQGIKICRGQLITGRQKLCAETGISERTIRTCLARLVSSGEIIIKATNKHSIITICKYADYQYRKEQSDQPTDQQNDQQSDQPTDHIIRRKEEKNITLSPNVDKVSPTRTRERRKEKTEKRANIQKSVTLTTRGREVFEAYYLELFGDAYYWSGAKDAIAIKQLFQKIAHSRSNRASPLPVDEDSLVEAFGKFLRSINKAWILNNFSLPKINSQYNDIIAEIKNNRNNGAGKSISQTTSVGAAIIANQKATVVNDIAKADEYYYKHRQQSS